MGTHHLYTTLELGGDHRYIFRENTLVSSTPFVVRVDGTDGVRLRHLVTPSRDGTTQYTFSEPLTALELTVQDGATVRGTFSHLDELYLKNYARLNIDALLSSMLVVEGDATSVVEIWSKDDASTVVGTGIIVELYEHDYKSKQLA